MISMEGVPSSLILRNESWVRKHAASLVRHLPSNVERADLIQAGLIAVAQAAMGFEWEGDRETEEAREAFVRYARHRVHGAMLDELRQMDHLSRARRRQVKLVQVARERWRSSHGTEATAAQLSPLCGLSVNDIFELEAEAMQAQTVSASESDDSEDADNGGHTSQREPATPQDEVEARVDTGMLLRRLEGFFAKLPERDRQVIDAYLGVGLSPVELAQALKVSPSRLSQMFKAVCDRVGVHMGHAGQRSTDRARVGGRERLDELITQRERELAPPVPGGKAWGQGLADVLLTTRDFATGHPEDQPIVVDGNTRWG